MKKSIIISFLILPFFSLSAENGVKFNSDFTITTEGYIHTNSEYLGWNYDFFDRKPFLALELDLEINGLISSYVEFPIMKDRYIAELSKENWTNAITSPSEVDMNIPNIAYFDIDMPHFNFSFGRDRLKMGQGLLISPNTFYHDYLSYSVFWGGFRYNYTMLDLEQIDVDNTGAVTDTFKKYLMAHTISFNIKDKFNISITESGIQGKLGFDFRYLNPFLIIHNEYLSESDFGNAFSTINIDYTPIENINIYAEFALDQYASPYENSRWEQEEPNALGLILGAKGNIPINRLKLNFLLSFVHADPCLGLDSSGINFTTSKRYVTQSQGSNDDANGQIVTDFLGIGADRQIYTLSLDLEGLDRLYLGFEYNLKRLGEVGANYFFKIYDKYAVSRTTPSGYVDTINIITLKAGYDFTTTLNIYSELSYINQDNINDVQLILSLSQTF